MKRLKDAVLKIDPDWFWYFIGQADYNYGDKIIQNGVELYNPIMEWPSLNEWIVSELEHELDNYEEEKEDPGSTMGSWVTSKTKARVERILDNYYNDKYIKE